jgi:hypothetical protein
MHFVRLPGKPQPHLMGISLVEHIINHLKAATNFGSSF